MPIDFCLHIRVVKRHDDDDDVITITMLINKTMKCSGVLLESDCCTTDHHVQARQKTLCIWTDPTQVIGRWFQISSSIVVLLKINLTSNRIHD